MAENLNQHRAKLLKERDKWTIGSSGLINHDTLLQLYAETLQQIDEEQEEDGGAGHVQASSSANLLRLRRVIHAKLVRATRAYHNFVAASGEFTAAPSTKLTQRHQALDDGPAWLFEAGMRSLLAIIPRLQQSEHPACVEACKDSLESLATSVNDLPPCSLKTKWQPAMDELVCMLNGLTHVFPELLTGTLTALAIASLFEQLFGQMGSKSVAFADSHTAQYAEQEHGGAGHSEKAGRTQVDQSGLGLPVPEAWIPSGPLAVLSQLEVPQLTSATCAAVDGRYLYVADRDSLIRAECFNSCEVVRSTAFDSSITWLSFSREFVLLMRTASSERGSLLCVDSESLTVCHSLQQDFAEGVDGMLIGDQGVQLGCTLDAVVLVDSTTGRFVILSLSAGLPQMHAGSLSLPMQLQPRVWLAGGVPWCADAAVALELPAASAESLLLQYDPAPKQVTCNEKLTLFVGASGGAWFVGDSSLWGPALQHVCSKIPMMVPGTQGLSISSCAMGQEHALFVTTSGAVFSAGSGSNGELGRIHKSGRPQAACEISALRGYNVTSAACGSGRSAVITAAGELLMFGRPLLRSHHLQHKRNWLLEPAEEVVVLREGENASQWQTVKVEALHKKPERGLPELYQVVFADGHHEVLSRHNLRRKSAGADILQPEDDMFKHMPSSATELSDLHIAECSLGSEHCLVMTVDGQLCTFGDSQHGQCGRLLKVAAPEVMEFEDDAPVTAIAAGPWHSAVVASNCLYTFGSATHGQLGRNDNVSQAVRVQMFEGKVCRVAACDGITVISTVGGEVAAIGLQVDGAKALNRPEQVLSLAVCPNRIAAVLQPHTEQPFASVGAAVLCGSSGSLSLQLQQADWYTWSLITGLTVEPLHSVGRFNLLCQHPSCSLFWSSADAHPGVLFLAGNAEQVLAAQRVSSVEDIIRSPQMSLPVGSQYTSTLHTAGLLLAAIAAVEQQQEPVHCESLAEKIRAAPPSCHAATHTESDSVHRFSSIQNGWYLGGSADAISFTVDKRMQIDSVLLFGGSGKYTVDLKICEGPNELLNVARDAYGPTVHEFVANDAEMVAVDLENPLFIEPSQVYTVACTMQGEQSYYGSSGSDHTTSTDSCATFKWFASDLSPNGTGVTSGQIGGLRFTTRQSAQPNDAAQSKAAPALPKLPALLESMQPKDWDVVGQLLSIATDAMSVFHKDSLAIDQMQHHDDLAHDSTALAVWKPSTDNFTPDPSLSPPAGVRHQIEAPWTKCYLSPSDVSRFPRDIRTHKKRDQGDEPSMSFSASPESYSPVSESYSPSASYSPVAHSRPQSNEPAPSQQTDFGSQSASLSPSQASHASHQQSTERWNHTEFIVATTIQLLKTALRKGSKWGQEEHAPLVTEVCCFVENCISSINYYHPLVCEAAKEAYTECFSLFFPSWTMRRALLVRMLSDVAHGVQDLLAFPLFEAFCTSLMEIEDWTVALGFEAGSVASDSSLTPMQKAVSNSFIEANLEIVMAANDGGAQLLVQLLLSIHDPRFTCTPGRMVCSTVLEGLIQRLLTTACICAPVSVLASTLTSYTAKRFGATTMSNWCCGTDAISFMTDARCVIHGIGLYAGGGAYSNFSIGLCEGCQPNEDETVAQATSCAIEGHDAETHTVSFDKSFTIERDTWYTVWANMNGNDSCQGTKGKESVRSESGITFKFQTTQGSSNGCTVSLGQIPEIVHSILPSTTSMDDTADADAAITRFMWYGSEAVGASVPSGWAAAKSVTLDQDNMAAYFAPTNASRVKIVSDSVLPELCKELYFEVSVMSVGNRPDIATRVGVACSSPDALGWWFKADQPLLADDVVGCYIHDDCLAFFLNGRRVDCEMQLDAVSEDGKYHAAVLGAPGARVMLNCGGRSCPFQWPLWESRRQAAAAHVHTLCLKDEIHSNPNVSQAEIDSDSTWPQTSPQGSLFRVISHCLLRANELLNTTGPDVLHYPLFTHTIPTLLTSLDIARTTRLSCTEGHKDSAIELFLPALLKLLRRLAYMRPHQTPRVSKRLPEPSVVQLASAHPYQGGTKCKLEVEFVGAAQDWIDLSFKPQCKTLGKADRLCLYADAGYEKQFLGPLAGSGAEGSWLSGPVLIPGNKLVVDWSCGSEPHAAKDEAQWGVEFTVSSGLREHARSALDQLQGCLTLHLARYAAQLTGFAKQCSVVCPSPMLTQGLFRQFHLQEIDSNMVAALQMLHEFVECEGRVGQALSEWLLAASEFDGSDAMALAARQLLAGVVWHHGCANAVVKLVHTQFSNGHQAVMDDTLGAELLSVWRVCISQLEEYCRTSDGVQNDIPYYPNQNIFETPDFDFDPEELISGYDSEPKTGPEPETPRDTLHHPSDVPLSAAEAESVHGDSPSSAESNDEYLLKELGRRAGLLLQVYPLTRCTRLHQPAATITQQSLSSHPAKYRSAPNSPRQSTGLEALIRANHSSPFTPHGEKQGNTSQSNLTISLVNSAALKQTLAFATDQSLCADVLLHGLEESHCTAEQRLEGLQLFVRLLNYASSDEAKYQVLLSWCTCMHGQSYLDGLPFHSVVMETTLREQWAAFLVQVVALLSRDSPTESSLVVAALQCWHSPFASEHDLAFLHEVDIFSVMSSLIVPPEAQYEPASQGVKVHALELVTRKFSLQVVENPGMADSLLEADNTTFWESGNEEPATICVVFNQPTQFREVSLFLSNASDMLHAVKRITVGVGASPQWCEEVTECTALKQRDGWFSISLPRQVSNQCIKVTLYPTRPRQSVRVRGLKIFNDSDIHEGHGLTVELMTPSQRVAVQCASSFNHLVKEALGELMTNEGSAEMFSPDPAAAVNGASNLRERVVALLFERRGSSQLSDLQGSVFHVIFSNLRAARPRFEQNPGGASSHDTFCFELLLMAASLSGSHKGLSFMANAETVSTLLSLLSVTRIPIRIARQLVLLLRRLLPRVNKIPKDAVAVLLGALGRAFAVQVSSAGAMPKHLQSPDGAPASEDDKMRVHALAKEIVNCIAGLHENSDWTHEVERTVQLHLASLLKLRSCGDDEVAAHGAEPWFWLMVAAVHLTGCVTALQSSLELNDDSESEEMDSSLLCMYCAESPATLQCRDCDRDMSQLCHECCSVLHLPTTMRSHSLRPLGINPATKTEQSGEVLCGQCSATSATVHCAECDMPMCTHCSSVIHRARSKADHHLSSVLNTEPAATCSGIYMVVHEGAARIKLSWLSLNADLTKFKMLFSLRPSQPPQSNGAVLCQFCGTTQPEDYDCCKDLCEEWSPAALGWCCEDEECQQKREISCTCVHDCGHPCGGVRNEVNCPPCLSSNCTSVSGLKQDAADMCHICWTEELGVAPVVRLECGHIFHWACVEQLLKSRWSGARITFGFLQCPLCKQSMESLDHFPPMMQMVSAIQTLLKAVQQKALCRLEYEGDCTSEVVEQWGGDKAAYAMHRYAYYLCADCGEPYFGGNYECAAVAPVNFDPKELICPGCSANSSTQICTRHGKEYLQFKCRYCCSVAVFFCFGTTHFCSACHEDLAVQDIRKEALPPCPTGPVGTALTGDCPLGVAHPPAGEEFCLGCSICRRAQLQKF